MLSTLWLASQVLVRAEELAWGVGGSSPSKFTLFFHLFFPFLTAWYVDTAIIRQLICRMIFAGLMRIAIEMGNTMELFAQCATSYGKELRMSTTLLMLSQQSRCWNPGLRDIEGILRPDHLDAITFSTLRRDLPTRICLLFMQICGLLQEWIRNSNDLKG